MTRNANRPAIADRLTLAIREMSHPFTPKHAGKCPLLGVTYNTWDKVRRVVLVNVASGQDFTAYIPTTTISAMEFTLKCTAKEQEINAEGGSTMFTRPDADAMLAALDAGHRVDIITKARFTSGKPQAYQTWTKEGGKFGIWHGYHNKTAGQFGAQVVKNVLAFRIMYA